MARKKYTTEYVNLKPIIEKYSNCTYFMFFGERGDGKTYGALDVIIDSIKNHKKFVYLRRLHQHIVRKNMVKVFDNVAHLCKERLDSEIYFDTQKGFMLEDGTIVGYQMSVQDAMLAKSIPLTDIEYILFDEFIDYEYMENEIQKFLHIISTICRPPNENVKIIMCGNTIPSDNPYFKLFGFDGYKLNQGEPYYIKHSLGVETVIYRTKTKVDDIISKTKSNKYVGFDDNATVSMIMFGEWEYNICNISSIDGIGWNCMKKRIPLYISSNGNTFELSIHYESKIPIAFCRKINTQNGKVKSDIKYSICTDGSVKLISNKGFVPTLTKINTFFIDTSTRNDLNVFNECYENHRIIFDNIESGSLFITEYKKLR